MSLPSNWTETIFSKLTLIYGRDFTGRWEGMNICDIKTDWSDELDGYDKRPKAIAWALDNLPSSKPPTVLEFRKLCNTLPQKEAVFIEPPWAKAELIAAELLRMGGMREKPVMTDMKAWAKRIIARHEQGDKIRPYSLKCAEGALGIAKKQVAA